MTQNNKYLTYTPKTPTHRKGSIQFKLKNLILFTEIGIKVYQETLNYFL